eukprot:764056-Hanusia_phi.AAC.2
MALKHVLGVFGVIVFGIVEVAGLYHKFQGYVGQTEGNIILIIFFCLAGLTLFTYYKVITMSPGRATDLSGPYMESGRAADGRGSEDGSSRLNASEQARRCVIVRSVNVSSRKDATTAPTAM